MENSAENVGPEYRDDSLVSAQNRTWEALREVASRIRTGMIERDAHEILKTVLKEKGAEKSWHPPQIRFGVNTTKAFGKPGEKDVPLKAQDIFFLDIGPVFDGYEGDAGETFVLGEDAELTQLATDAREVFEQVKTEWIRTGATGQSLYQFAEKVARERGWRLSLEGASGHRVSDFPHAIHHRGKLRTYESRPSPHRWILEIHLFHPVREVGAFYEDLL